MPCSPRRARNLEASCAPAAINYQNFAKDASQRLQEMELSPRSQTPLSRLSIRVGIAANTMLDSSPSHLAGNDDQQRHHGHHRPGKRLKQCGESDPEVQRLGKETYWNLNNRASTD